MSRFDRRFIDERELLSLLVESVVDYAIFVLDERGYIRTWNRGAQRLKGYRRAEIIGEHYSLFYPEDDRKAGLPEVLLARAEQHGSAKHSGWRVRKDGSRFWADVVLTALLDKASGELIGFAKVTRELTDRHHIEAALQRALAREREAATELNRLFDLRTQFLAGVVHDLTTPVIIIRDIVDLLLDQTSDEGDGEDGLDLREALVLVADNVERLDELTRQLGVFAQLERGRTELSPEVLDLRMALERCVEPLKRTLSDVNVEIEVEGAVEADPVAFGRILTNLLTNAARHSPQGSTISITSRRERGEVEISVTDQGPGIPQDELDNVFDEFYQGPSPESWGRGFGLGLTIVHNYVQHHGGVVWVESTPGQGATFRFTLPAPAA